MAVDTFTYCLPDLHCGLTRVSLSPTAWRSLRICIVYAFTSMTISMLYKLLLSSYQYQAMFTMLSEQLAMSLLFCAIARTFLSNIPGLEVPKFRWEVFRAAILPGTLFVANIVVGWAGLRLVNIPLFLCLRRTTTAFTLLFEFVILGRRQNTSVNASVLIIVAGAVLAGWQSLNREWLGVALTICNNILTAASMNFQKRFSDTHNIRGFGLVMYNALVALPLCLIGASWNNEWSYTGSFESRSEVGFWTAMASASLLGLCMTYVTFLCTTVNSPLATSVTGNAKDVIATVVAALAFQDFQPTLPSVGGILLSFVGAGWFSYEKLREVTTATPSSTSGTQPATVIDLARYHAAAKAALANRATVVIVANGSNSMNTNSSSTQTTALPGVIRIRGQPRRANWNALPDVPTVAPPVVSSPRRAYVPVAIDSLMDHANDLLTTQVFDEQLTAGRVSNGDIPEIRLPTVQSRNAVSNNNNNISDTVEMNPRSHHPLDVSLLDTSPQRNTERNTHLQEKSDGFVSNERDALRSHRHERAVSNAEHASSAHSRNSSNRGIFAMNHRQDARVMDMEDTGDDDPAPPSESASNSWHSGGDNDVKSGLNGTRNNVLGIVGEMTHRIPARYGTATSPDAGARTRLSRRSASVAADRGSSSNAIGSPPTNSIATTHSKHPSNSSMKEFSVTVSPTALSPLSNRNRTSSPSLANNTALASHQTSLVDDELEKRTSFNSLSSLFARALGWQAVPTTDNHNSAQQ